MKPSFSALFSRGRYLRGPNLDPETEEEKKEARRIMREFERFAVAAIGFCFRYDPNFRKQFWKIVCDQPHIPPLEEIQIEPAHWADLRLSHNHDGMRHVYIIEFKLGADLQPKQDPTNPAFANAAGYGALLCDSAKNCRLHYILLGHRHSLNLPRKHGRLDLYLSECRWEKIEPICSASELGSDFADLLGNFGIEPFHMNIAKKITVTNGLCSIGKAWEVLTATAKSLQLQTGKINAGDDGTGHWNVGTHIRRTAKGEASKLQRSLEKVCPSGWCVAWFGYEGDRDDRVQRSVWIYCTSESQRDDILKTLRSIIGSLGTIEPEFDSKFCAVVRSAAGANDSDLNWFSEVFRLADSISKSHPG